MLKKLWPIFLIAIVIGVFFWKAIWQGAILVPTDLLVGAYYPWRENNWGYDVAVPYKNPLISDSYSQFFVWKKLIADAYRSGEWPLWNQYSYSGYPLLANLHSGALYPLNGLMVVLPFNTGWNAFLISGMVLSAIAMYWMLRTLGRRKVSSVAGGLAWAMCGYSISWLEFATASQTMIWIPLLIGVSYKFFETKKKVYLWWITPLLFLLISVGHFQITVYTTLVLGGWILVNTLKRRKTEGVLTMVGVVVLSGAMSAAVLLPSWELMSMSIRNVEGVIADINYGLAPWGNFITLIAPDFFGNPATNNFWGFLNYHEVLIYSGVVVAIAWGWSIFNFKKLGFEDKFFFWLTIVAIMMFFDNPASRLFFQMNIPGLGTGMAGRVAIIFSMGGSVLLSLMIEKITGDDWKAVVKYHLPWLGLVVVVGTVLWFNYDLDPTNVRTALRNMVIPTGLIATSLAVTLIFRKYRVFGWMMILLLIIDVFRFGWKYLPFSEEKYVFPSTQTTDFLQKDTSMFRVDKEYGPLLSPNTWSMYGLMSPSGYDPMAVANYTKKFNQDINGDKENYSRYAEVKKYDAEILGEYNVKYLMVLKRDKEGNIGGEKINGLIDLADWKKVAESRTTAVLENTKNKARAFTNNGKVQIEQYQANKVVVRYELTDKGEVILLDSYHPGWIARVNGEVKPIDRYREVFRSVKVDEGEGVIEFKYEPITFYWGIRITVTALLVWSGIMLYYWQRCLKRESF